jgi:hypothetical protein
MEDWTTSNAFLSLPVIVLVNHRISGVDLKYGPAFARMSSPWATVPNLLTVDIVFKLRFLWALINQCRLVRLTLIFMLLLAVLIQGAQRIDGELSDSFLWDYPVSKLDRLLNIFAVLDCIAILSNRESTLKGRPSLVLDAVVGRARLSFNA